MPRIVNAVFDGKALIPEEPLELEPNTRVVVAVGRLGKTGKPYISLDTMAAMNLEGPEDLSDRLEEYLYGTGDDSDK